MSTAVYPIWSDLFRDKTGQAAPHRAIYRPPVAEFNLEEVSCRVSPVTMF